MSTEEAATGTPPESEGKPSADAPRAEEEEASRPPTTPPEAPSTREEAVSLLRGASGLANVRSEKIISAGISRLDGAGTVNIFQGDFSIGGDFSTGGGGRRTSPRRASKVRVPADFLAEEADSYVPSADFHAGTNTLRENFLAVFSGPAGTGRSGRARTTLVQVLRAAGLELNVFELGGSVLGNMTWRVPQRACGFIVVDRPNSQGKFVAETSVTEAWLNYASAQLEDSNSFLVVITGPVTGGELATAPNRHDFVIEDMELPDPMEIVRRRVRQVIPSMGEEELAALLADTRLAELLDERDDPQFAARAGKVVADAIRDDSDLGTAVAQLGDPEGRVREWLSTEPDAAEIAFVLATAALEESSYLNVADAAVALSRQIGNGTAKLTPRYLRKLMAERSWIEYLEQPGESYRPSILRFRHAELRPSVLALIWFELDGARDKILPWLTNLAEHADVEVRARAAVAAGILAASDFEHGVHRYLRPWAAHKSPTLRQSAALGLNVAGRVGVPAHAVWDYITAWADQLTFGDHRYLPATAALAAGGPLGVAEPRRALRVLRTVVCDGGWELLTPAAITTHALLEAGLVNEVLTALIEWTEPGTADEPLEKALNMFAFAAWEEGSADTDAADRPVLLLSAAKHRDALTRLWGRALSTEAVRPLALDSLHDWIRVADRDPSVQEDVLLLLGGIADRGPDDFERICHALHGWAVDRDEPLDAAAYFYNELIEAGELTA
ncbi:hypothetical protein [Amycolatopsis sp. 195334CR]|uniref:hypothetical protein n=1 Tax=Amycolatopsis sp. 195334CR TaxID=2814588 RepID=UPI001A8CF166|nr:hypothetical protein [Amycolatopsis sp. 195334CR]MBN6039295.1 hypothetical protein [Amycolatopsis sp. 195334CR]